jgi:hypothetical protein
VRCKQPQDFKLPLLPRSNQWVQCVPPLPGSLDKNEACRASVEIVQWAEAAALVVDKLRGVRGEEHACLDDAEAKGLIRQ